jgi:hypothetical protein
MALIANVNRDPKVRKRPFQPADFDPHGQKPAREKPALTLSVKEAKGLLLGLKPKRRG